MWFLNKPYLAIAYIKLYREGNMRKARKIHRKLVIVFLPFALVLWLTGWILLCLKKETKSCQYKGSVASAPVSSPRYFWTAVAPHGAEPQRAGLSVKNKELIA
jgi:hypothetical protein